MTTIKRDTKETKIELTLEVNGTGKSTIYTGIGFFDHMLEAFTKHSLMDLNVKCVGDLHVDFHHTVEDVAIVLGQAFAKEIYPISNVERFSNVVVVMDETAIECSLDLCNRAYLVHDVLLHGKVGEFDVELAEEFFKSFISNSRITAHIIKHRGTNKHHQIEASFKALAVALRRALIENKRSGTPSTKGVL